MKTALILGVLGQDGALLARCLLRKGYQVHGTSRDAQIANLENLNILRIRGSVELHSAVPTDFRSILQVLTRCVPDEVYALAGQSSVGLSFDEPVETLESVALGTLNLLEAIRFLRLPTRFYNAGSGECFGDTDTLADETTAFRPRSPYAVAKSCAYWTVANYRDSYNLYACTGILFNHESPLRPTRFVTRKIVAAACRIAAGLPARLQLGNLDICRDWGWAPEYVEAMWLMLQQSQPRDYLIATGTSYALSEFVATAFAGVGLDWRDHVDVDPRLFRPSEVTRSLASPRRAADELCWRASLTMPDVVERMIIAERAGIENVELWLH